MLLFPLLSPSRPLRQPSFQPLQPSHPDTERLPPVAPFYSSNDLFPFFLFSSALLFLIFFFLRSPLPPHEPHEPHEPIPITGYPRKAACTLITHCLVLLRFADSRDSAPTPSYNQLLLPVSSLVTFPTRISLHLLRPASFSLRHRSSTALPPRRSRPVLSRLSRACSVDVPAPHRQPALA